MFTILRTCRQARYARALAAALICMLPLLYDTRLCALCLSPFIDHSRLPPSLCRLSVYFIFISHCHVNVATPSRCRLRAAPRYAA